MYTNYRCIPFHPNDCRVRYYHSEFSTQNCLQCIFLSSSKKKKVEMSFMRVSDLLLVCVVINHDADSRHISLKMIFSLKINEKCIKTENDIKLCLSTWVTLCPYMAERCRHKKCHLRFILFVFALLVHPLVGHIPNIDCVVCL